MTFGNKIFSFLHFFAHLNFKVFFSSLKHRVNVGVAEREKVRNNFGSDNFIVFNCLSMKRREKKARAERPAEMVVQPCLKVKSGIVSVANYVGERAQSINFTCFPWASPFWFTSHLPLLTFVTLQLENHSSSHFFFFKISPSLFTLIFHLFLFF